MSRAGELFFLRAAPLWGHCSSCFNGIKIKIKKERCCSSCSSISTLRVLSSCLDGFGPQFEPLCFCLCSTILLPDSGLVRVNQPLSIPMDGTGCANSRNFPSLLPIPPSPSGEEILETALKMFPGAAAVEAVL